MSELTLASPQVLGLHITEHSEERYLVCVVRFDTDQSESVEKGDVLHIAEENLKYTIDVRVDVIQESQTEKIAAHTKSLGYITRRRVAGKVLGVWIPKP